MVSVHSSESLSKTQISVSLRQAWSTVLRKETLSQKKKKKKEKNLTNNHLRILLHTTENGLKTALAVLNAVKD
jgi:hypothetical protein